MYKNRHVDIPMPHKQDPTHRKEWRFVNAEEIEKGESHRSTINLVYKHDHL